MSKHRIKPTPEPELTRDEVEAIVNDMALTKLHEIRLTAKMDAEILAIRDRYAGNLAAYTASLKQLGARLETWADTHPEEFKARKSIDFSAGTIGYRTGNWRCSLLSKKWNWQKVLDTLKNLPAMAAYIRTAPEVNKEQIIADRAVLTADALGTIGVKVHQDEVFFIEPNLTAVETKTTLAA